MDRRNRTGKAGGQKHNTNTLKHGAYRSNKALVHDKRTKIARTVFHFQQALVESLGGEDSISIQQKLVLDRASFKATRCILAESAMIANNGNVSKDLKEEYIKWSHSLREDLKILGMNRIAREIEVKSIQKYVAETYSNNEDQH